MRAKVEGRGMNDEGRVERDLIARTKAYALAIIRMYSSLPKSTVAQVLGKQVLRSGTSVGANYREAQRARSKAEFVAKIGDSLKELDETTYWLELLSETDVLIASRVKDLRIESEELLAIFTTISKRSKSNLS